MKKILKLFLVLICLFIVSMPSVLAVDIDMNISNNNQSVVANNTTDTDNDADNDNTNTNIANPITSPSQTTKVSTTDATDDFELTVSDIINIILISVGIVLIFLSIAILIKIH